LLLIGSGPRKNELERQISELGIAHLVTFTGRLNPVEMIPYLSQADIGISSYCGRVEFSGLKLLDYKAAGLAIIASGQNGQPAVLKHGQTGWLVPPCNEDELAEAIIHLTDHVDLRRHLGQQARIEAETTHSWRHTSEQLEEIFFRFAD
jgi:glycosyltransferase involved in cell wall biosynthesis